MLFFYLLIILSGLGWAGWLFFSESKKEEKNNAKSLVERFNLEELDKKSIKTSIQTPIAEFKTPTSQKTEISNLSVEITQADLDRIEKEIDATPIIDHELQLKYEKLERLLKDTTIDLEKTEKALESELKAKKEFNKTKDTLEKEIKEHKDRNHQLQLELGAAKAESENYKKRTNQLEEKVRNKEQEVKKKEHDIDDLVKRLQTFAAPQPPIPQKIPETPAPAPQQPMPPPLISEPIPVKESTPEPTKPVAEKPLEKAEIHLPKTAIQEILQEMSQQEAVSQNAIATPSLEKENIDLKSVEPPQEPSPTPKEESKANIPNKTITEVPIPAESKKEEELAQETPESLATEPTETIPLEKTTVSLNTEATKPPEPLLAQQQPKETMEAQKQDHPKETKIQPPEEKKLMQGEVIRQPPRKRS